MERLELEQQLLAKGTDQMAVDRLTRVGLHKEGAQLGSDSSARTFGPTEAQAVVLREVLMPYGNLLAIIGTIRPELWDVIITHGPLARSSRSYSPRVGVVPALDRVALNPQPLPPRETLLAGAAEMAHEVVRLAVASKTQGTSSVTFVREVIGDWCGTPWPRKWPWPWPGPRPGTEPEGPQPQPWAQGPQPDQWDVQTARVIGAIIFASVASRLSIGDLRTAFAEGADRLAEAALAD